MNPANDMLIDNDEPHFVLCLRKGDDDDLVVRKVYRLLPARTNEAGFLRVIDESGEDYLYPSDYFAPLNLPGEVEHALAQVA